MKSNMRLSTLKENGLVALVAIGFLSLVLFLSYITWSA
jgi:hypothetical protein